MKQAAIEIVTDYFIDGMPNEEYHKPEYGVSTSVIKSFMDDPALIKWARKAPQDKSKLDAVDFGTDFHLYFLEPDVFERTHKVLPQFNRRIKAEKEAELELIKEWEASGITAVTHEDMQKLKQMRDSALAHPTVAAIMALDGVAERSYFWTDPTTGVECKCRPDWLVLDINDSNRPAFMPTHCTTLVTDIKSVARMDRMQNQMEELKYYVQDVFYTDGIQTVTNSEVCFVFACVSTTYSLGRYPVQVVMLTDTAKFDGRREVAVALARYAELKSNETEQSWQTVITMDRPSWATREEDIF